MKTQNLCRAVMCAVLAVAFQARAEGEAGQKPMTGGQGAIRVDEKVMKQMKAKGEKAMSEHKAWLDKNLQGWPEKTKEVVANTIAAYGEPQAVSAAMLVWGKSGPWKRMLLYRDPVAHNFPMPHEDVLEQFIDYPVSAEKVDELAQYDGSVVAARTAGELSARCNNEAANYLALNLARDVAEGKRSVAEARDFYAATIKGMLEGKMDDYLKGLNFEPRSGGDRDQQRFPNPMLKQSARP